MKAIIARQSYLANSRALALEANFFPEDSSFEFSLIVFDPPCPAYSSERLFQTPSLSMDLPSSTDKSTRLIRLADLKSGAGRAKIMQLILIGGMPYLLIAGEATGSDDIELSRKLPDGFSQNWQADLIKLESEGPLVPICSYRVHTRTILYGG
jgi:hypothetical protein